MLITCAAVVYHAPRGRKLSTVLCLDGAFYDDITTFHIFAMLLLFCFHNLLEFPPFIGPACCPAQLSGVERCPFFHYTNIQLYFILCKLFTNFLQKKRFFFLDAAGRVPSHAQPAATGTDTDNRTELVTFCKRKVANG